MSKTTMNRVRRSITLVLSGMLIAPLSQAQTSGEDDTVGLEEVIVTAQKREQSAMDIPVTVDVFSASDIEKTGALNLAEIQDFIPGFEVGLSATQSSIAIRGVSSANISTGGDPSVATFYDDVYLPRGATSMAFSDLARVEVLKGPQGTLYGRNAAAGVVNVIPNSPAAGTEGFIRTRLGNYSLVRVEAMGNMAVTDNFFLRGNILSNQRDGFAKNVIDGQPDPGEQGNIVARVAGLWNISDDTALQVSYDYDKVDNSARGAWGVSEWSECPDDPFCGKVRNDVIDGDETRDMYALTGKLSHSFNESWSAKLIVSYRDYQLTNRQDEDGTAEFDRYLDTDNIEDSDIQYNELQFNYSGDRYDIVFGGVYSKESTYQEIPVNTNADSAMRAVTAGIASAFGLPFDHLWNPGEMAFLMSALTQQPISPEMIVATGDYFYDMLDSFLPGTPVVGPSYAGQSWTEMYFNEGDFTNWGVYGDMDFRFNDKWSMLLGLRYSKDEKTFSWRNPPNTLNEIRPGTADIVFLPVPGYEQARTGTLVASDSWDKITGRAVINYQINDDALTYLSYSTGYKSGGFDSLDVTTSDNPLRPEESENIEWAIKGDFFNQRLRTQLSLFQLNIDGRQRTVDTKPPEQPQAIPTVINGDQEFTGAELVLNWLISDTVQLGFVTTWRDEESTWDPFYNAVGELVTETTSSTTDTDYSLWLDWYPQISKGTLAIRGEYFFYENNDEFDPGVVDPTLPGFGEDRKLLNGRIAWMNDRWTVALWAKNLLDTEVASSVSDISTASFGTPFVTIDPPRTYGIEVGYNF